MTAASVLLPVLVPARTSVRGPEETKPMLPRFVKLIAPVPEASITPSAPGAPVPRVNSRSVDAAPPVYLSMPPSPSTRLPAALVEAPILLATPPLARLLIESTPPAIAVTPV